jgi:hypothetical protein
VEKSPVQETDFFLDLSSWLKLFRFELLLAEIELNVSLGSFSRISGLPRPLVWEMSRIVSHRFLSTCHVCVFVPSKTRQGPPL